MGQKKANMDVASMVWATHRAIDTKRHYVEMASKMELDPGKEQRIKKGECVACFYTSRIGGAMITTRACGLCGKSEVYSSTATDALCPECAKKHNLCKHCGGDIDMKARRKKWPNLGGERG